MLLVLYKLDQESSLIWLRLCPKQPRFVDTAKMCTSGVHDIFGQAKQYEPWLLPAPGHI